MRRIDIEKKRRACYDFLLLATCRKENHVANRTAVFCENCQKETEHMHLHDTAHGIPETHMSGTEQYQCSKCGNALFKEEGVKKGLSFILD